MDVSDITGKCTRSDRLITRLRGRTRQVIRSMVERHQVVPIQVFEGVIPSRQQDGKEPRGW